MKRKLGVLMLLVMFVLGSCAKNEEPMVSGDTKRDTENSAKATASTDKQDNQDETNQQNEALAKPLTYQEKTLGITVKNRAEFIKKFGEEAYSTCMMAVPLYLNLYNNSQSKITEQNIEKYKKNYTVENIELTSSFDGHTIPADYIINGHKNCDTVIMVHGAGQNRRGNNEQVDLFLSLGYNVLQYDQRCSGDNTAVLTTYGIWEKNDLFDYVKYIDKELDEEKKIVIYGKSMGGAAVLSLMGVSDAEEYVDYAILDCPVVSMKQMFYSGIKNYCEEQYIDETYQVCNEFTKSFLGFTFDDGEAAITAKNAKIPFLMFATEGDEILSYEDQKQFYDAVDSKVKYLYTSMNAKHCCIFSDENAAYTELISELLSGELLDS